MRSGIGGARELAEIVMVAEVERAGPGADGGGRLARCGRVVRGKAPCPPFIIS